MINVYIGCILQFVFPSDSTAYVDVSAYKIIVYLLHSHALARRPLNIVRAQNKKKKRPTAEISASDPVIYLPGKASAWRLKRVVVARFVVK